MGRAVGGVGGGQKVRQASEGWGHGGGESVKVAQVQGRCNTGPSMGVVMPCRGMSE